MKKLITLLFLASVVHADILADGSNVFTNDTKTLVVSSQTASPTQILTSDSFITRTWIVNNTSFTVLLSTLSNNFNAASTSGIPPCVTGSTCQPWTPDGPAVPYWGQLFAVIQGTSTTGTGNTLSVFRLK